MFAIGVTSVDMNTGNRYFDVSMTYTHVDNGVKTKHSVPLTACNRTVWANLGFASSYDRLGFSKWLCPSPDLALILQGKYTSDVFIYYKIALSQCNATLNPLRPCVSSATIQNYLNLN